MATPDDVIARLRGIAASPAAAAARLAEIEARIARGEPTGESLRTRLDLYYFANGTGPADYEPDDDEGDDWDD